jgi:hypothetical protein
MNVVCQSPCLWLGDHLDFCKPPTATDRATMWTWVPKGSEWIYLIKITGHTLAYVPSNDTIYFANPAFALRNTCPVTTVFMAQCVCDVDCEPRLLVVDLVCEKGKTTPGAMNRYVRLQELQCHFPEPAVSLQWSGNKEAIDRRFLESLPHKTQALVGFGEAAGELCVEDI